MKNHTQNVVDKLFADPFLKSQNRVYFWINNLKFYGNSFVSNCRERGKGFG